MKSQEFKELLDKFSRGECSPEEERFILDWYENIGGPRHQSLKSDNRDSLKGKLWGKIDPQVHRPERGFSFYFARIAAAILVLFMASLGTYFAMRDGSLIKKDIASAETPVPVDPGYNRFINTGIKPSLLTLEDGTKVTLRPKSELRFAKKFPSQRREVYLTGEAFFEVKRDESRPFMVYSNEVVTQVLGTSFNIKAYEHEKEITVAVRTGRVSVYTNPPGETAANASGREAVILVPNQQVVYNRRNAKVVKQLVKDPEIILPNSTLFKMSFEEVPVEKIFKVLEENYGVDIVYDEEVLRKCTLTTAMSDEGLYQRIEVICKAIKAEYTVTDAMIVIKSSGCE